ncbi:P-loop NTPase fold protein [Paraglaciecola sp. L3A3]|uniref:P-loop NTPase fold protein n=1 Tax=Paraglaciecola sp. L3A3 TaxID=2686358 RepID=UPI00131D509E|nr:P-loop NTPase fold protein [Paraglaciecola sp. L3A3]
MLTETFINQHKLPSVFQQTAKEFYIPLADEIALHQKSAETSYFVGINGCQGSGKSTLSDYLKLYLEEKYNLSVIVMSLDDFYYSQDEREILATDVHPLFKTRGVPGTHDTSLIKQALEKIKSAQLPVTIPRFNKATDNPYNLSQWTKIDKQIDIVIFEGWCWGVDAQQESELEVPVNSLEALQDKQAIWRNYANTQLMLHYQPLYKYMDKWVMFKAPSFTDVYAWRLEQEQKLADSLGDKITDAVMNNEQIKNFIQYYQRLTEHSLNTLADKCEHVYILNSVRKIIEHQRRSEK